MKDLQKLGTLEGEIYRLVEHFGLARVRAVLAKLAVKARDRTNPGPLKVKASGRGKKPRTIMNRLESIRQSEPEKYRLLNEFLIRLVERRILPESQDIRLFAQLAGLKEIKGKARTDLIPALMRFLLEQPIERLRIDIKNAESISEQQRQRGFSVLTDRLVGRP